MDERLEQLRMVWPRLPWQVKLRVLGIALKWQILGALG